LTRTGQRPRPEGRKRPWLANEITAKDNREQESINLNPAVHRRNFLNDAISPADLEYAKPLSIHDHEGVPVHQHVHDKLVR
jgi:hypothetical protein